MNIVLLMMFVLVICGEFVNSFVHRPCGFKIKGHNACPLVPSPTGRFGFCQRYSEKSTASIHTSMIRPISVFGRTNRNSLEALRMISSSTPPLVRLHLRTAWASWWIQSILTAVSGVILTFANTVKNQDGNGGGSDLNTFWRSGFAFSSLGVTAAAANSLCTWMVIQFCRKVLRKVYSTPLVGGESSDDNRTEGKWRSTNTPSDSTIHKTLRRYMRLSVLISLVGTLVTLVGAEQTVGSLTARALTYSSPGGFPQPTLLFLTPNSGGSGGSVVGSAPPPGAVQALDIFLVQANTNTLLAHFVALVCCLGLLTRLPPAGTAAPPPIEEQLKEVVSEK